MKFFIAQPLGYSIQTAEIDDLAVTAVKLAADAVETAKIKDGAVTEVKQTLADNTTADVSSTKHGYVPKTPADATKFLNGAATAAFALVKDSDLSTSDITTNDVSSAKHGFAPKGDGSTTKFLNANGAYSTPTGGVAATKTARATWATNFTTTSTSYVDVTGATVTISGLTAGTTYDIYADSAFTLRSDAVGAIPYVALLIDGTNSSEIGTYPNTASDELPAALSAIKQSVTGATSYIAKLQAKIASSTLRLLTANIAATLSINVIAFPQ